MIGFDFVTTDDGRRLDIEVTGAPDGYPVIFLHGTPGSRLGPKPRHIVFYRSGIRFISYTRPGYGRSDPLPGRSVADAASDVAAIADKLGIDKFAVVGRSGGGPHALACAALLPDRVTHTAVLVGLAPAFAPGLDWYEGMAESNVEEYGAADSDDLTALIHMLTARATDAKGDPESIVEFLEPQLTGSDLRVVKDIAIRRMLLATYREALENGPDGWIDDARAFRRPWGFHLASIKTRVRLWHGKEDTFSPVHHAHWLERQLTNAEIEIEDGQAHFGAMEALPNMLTWLANAPSAIDRQRIRMGAVQ